MNDFPDGSDEQGDAPALPFARTRATMVVGMALMLLGMGAIVGGIIIHFAVKAERLNLFPYAGRLVVLIGMGLTIVAFVFVGRRVAVGSGIVTLVAGIGMLVFGYANLAEPSLRFLAPLGFFISLAGGFLIWCGFDFGKRVETPLASEKPPDRTKGLVTPDAELRTTIERPFDIGKPLRTASPVCRTCPNCGSSDYEAVKPAAMVAFASDRVCRVCSTRYTPPTPVWARITFGVIGLAALAFGAWMVYVMFVRGKPQPTLGLITPVVVLLVGIACLYKAATK
jgi:hypothetical protein